MAGEFYFAAAQNAASSDCGCNTPVLDVLHLTNATGELSAVQLELNADHAAVETTAGGRVERAAFCSYLANKHAAMTTGTSMPIFQQYLESLFDTCTGLMLPAAKTARPALMTDGLMTACLSTHT